MELIELIVCVSILVTKVCGAGLFAVSSKLDEASLVAATIDILESCYEDRSGTVGLAGPSVGSIITKISSRDIVIPVTMIDETSMTENHDPINRVSRYRLQVFVITTTNQSALVKTLKHIKRSIWWNHMASVLLIDLPEVENGCSNAAKILYQAWLWDLLNSKFICLHRTKGPLIYTFNPYISKAPVPWQEEGTYIPGNGHPWTLFVRKFRGDESRCDGLDFDKTVDLGGYEVRASVNGMETWWFKDPNLRPFLVNRMQNVTAEILMSSLNATWNLRAEPWNNNALLNEDLTQTFGIAAEVTSGMSDVCLNILIQNVLLNFDTTHTHHVFHLGVLTQYPGYKSQIEKIISVLDRRSRFGVLVVLMITLVFFKFWLRKPLILAILNLVLLICNAGLHGIPDRVAPRIYLASLFIFVVTIQGIYSGQFAALLTKNMRLPTINNLQDLARSDHTIYGASNYRIIFNESAFEERYVDLSGPQCSKNVILNSKAACVELLLVLADYAAENNLHLSQETLGLIYGAYLIRPDWPLEERVNRIFDQAAAGGIMEPLYSRERAKLMNRVTSIENQEQESGPRVLTLKHLNFAFLILGIGLLCATITFIVEVATFGTVIANPRTRIRRYIERTEYANN